MRRVAGGHAQIPQLNIKVVTRDYQVGCSSALGGHERGILDSGKLLVEDIWPGCQGLLVVRHELQRRLLVEGGLLPVVADVNKAMIGGVKEQ